MLMALFTSALSLQREASNVMIFLVVVATCSLHTLNGTIQVLVRIHAVVRHRKRLYQSLAINSW
jgi:hypothetical protein